MDYYPNIYNIFLYNISDY